MKGAIVVSGGRGFIGHSLTKQLLNANYKVYVLTRYKVRPNLPNLHFLTCDLLNSSITKKILGNIEADYAFHLASLGSHTKYYTINNKHLEAQMVANFISSLTRHSPNKFIIASGHVVYGNPIYVPIDEKHPLKPTTDYGKSKMMMEKSAARLLTKSNVPYTILRFSSVYGPGQPNIGLIPNLIDKALNNKKITIKGKGVSRDYLYIDDAINAFLLAMNGLPGTYNIGSGKSTLISSVAKYIVQEIGKGGIVCMPGKGPIPDNALNVNLAKKILKYKPSFSIRKGLKKEIEWFKKTTKKRF